MIKLDLWDSQIRAADSCMKMRRKIAAIDVGGGKTLAALSVIDRRNQEGKFLNVVLCPKSGIPAWTEDMDEYTDFTYSVNEFREDVKVNLFTFSHISELFQITKTLTKEHNAILIVDEAHILASANSDRAACLRGKTHWDVEGIQHFDGIIERFKFAYGFTGTLMINHIEDVFYLINSFFITQSGKKFFPDFEIFMNTYTIRELRKARRYNPLRRCQEDFWYKEVVGFQNLSILSKLLEPFIFRHAIDYKPNILVHKFELPEEEMDFYYEVGRGILSKQSKSFVSRLPLLQQAVNGSVDNFGKFRHGIDLTFKEQQLIDILNTIADKKEGALVFTQFKETTFKRFQVVKQFLKFKHYHFLSGDSKDEQRRSIVVNLQPQDVLFSTKAGGTSLNFRAVNNVVFYDLPWSVGEFLQNMGRITRGNTTYLELNVHLMLAKDTIDDYKYLLLQSNLSVQKELFGGFNFADIYFAKVRRGLVIELRKNLLWGIRKKGNRTLIPTIKCKNCGRFTNTSVSVWDFEGSEMFAKFCTAAWDERDKKWTRGCNYESACEFDRKFADKVIK